MQHRIVLLAATLAVAVPKVASAEPAIGKMGVVFHLVPHFHKPEWTWTPSLRFKVNGPISSAAVITVDYTFPNGKTFVKVQCENVSATEEKEFLTLNDCGYRQEDAVATNQTGVFGFKVTLSDALANTSKVLFAGKFTVGKRLYNPDKLPNKTKQFYYYVDQDWRLPMAYIGTENQMAAVYSEIWIKQNIVDQSKLHAYLFFNGKQVAEASASGTLRATPPELKEWEYHLLQFTFPAFTQKPDADGYTHWKLYENPGTYEVKMLRDGKIARTLKFTIGADGKPTDGGAAKASGIAAGALVPAVVVGDSDGTWRKDAWKTEAFFANPPSGL